MSRSEAIGKQRKRGFLSRTLRKSVALVSAACLCVCGIPAVAFAADSPATTDSAGITPFGVTVSGASTTYLDEEGNEYTDPTNPNVVWTVTFDHYSGYNTGRLDGVSGEGETFVLPETLTAADDPTFTETITMTNSSAASSTQIFSDAGTNLKKIDFSQTKITTIAKYCVGASNTNLGTGPCPYLEEVLFPETLFYVGNNAFCDCDNLKSVDFPGDRDISFAQYAFYDCDALESVNIEKSFVRFDNTYAFANCTNLKSVTFAEGSLLDADNEGYTFSGCTSLTEITLPIISTNFEEYYGDTDQNATTTALPATTFNNCTSLTTIGFMAGYTTLAGIIDNASNLPSSLTTLVFYGNTIGISNIFSSGRLSRATEYTTLDFYETEEDAQAATTQVEKVYPFDYYEYEFRGMVYDNSAKVGSVTAKDSATVVNIVSGSDTADLYTGSSVPDFPEGKTGEWTLSSNISSSTTMTDAVSSADSLGYAYFTLDANALENATIDLDGFNPDLVSGALDLSTIKVMDADGNELTADTDYTISITSGDDPIEAITEPGTYTLTVTGTGSYSGSQSVEITVAYDANSLDYATFDLSGVSLEIASGGALDLSGLKMLDVNGDVMSADAYTLTITNASGQTVDSVTEAGDYTITATGTGSYADTSVSTNITVTVATEPEPTPDPGTGEPDQGTNPDTETGPGPVVDNPTSGNTGNTGGSTLTKQTIKVKKAKVTVKGAKKATVKVKNAKTTLAFKANKKTKKALKIKVKGKKKLIIKAGKKAKKGKTYKIKVYAKASGSYAKSNVVKLKVKIK